jgi:hypothetical protein
MTHKVISVLRGQSILLQKIFIVVHLLPHPPPVRHKLRVQQVWMMMEQNLNVEG